ncbi:hypothetical protein GCM10009735_23530 [Actinomadura chokoriensis]
MATPEGIERAVTLTGAAVRYDELRVRDAVGRRRSNAGRCRSHSRSGRSSRGRRCAGGGSPRVGTADQGVVSAATAEGRRRGGSAVLRELAGRGGE